MTHMAFRTWEPPVSFFMELKKLILERHQAAEDYLSTKRTAWDSYEKLFHNQLNDSISEEGASKVFDPKLSTLTLERSYRVMSQMALGKAKGISKNDLGAGKLMDLIIDKYVNPNANAQFDLLTKFRMVDLYSNIYGNFFTLLDWDVKANGYVGPDLWLLNIRDVFPQVGAVSLDDSDYVIVRTWKPKSFFENLKKSKRDGYKNIEKILAKLEGKTGGKQERDTNSTSKREENQYPTGDAAKEKGYFEVFTMYERDRWIDFSVDGNEVFREIKNPHENGELPVDCKYSIPLLDDFMGMGDFERGASMQQVINSNWNLYLNAVKMSIFPPVIINKDNQAVPSSYQYLPAAKWLARGQINNVAMPLNLNPQGISTFNNTYQVANGSLLNLFGTTDTTVTSEVESGFGKTPQALKMQGQRENTRDNADRFYMEQYLKKVYRKMVNLIAKKQTSTIAIRMFEEEIVDLARSYPDIKEMYDEKTGKLTIHKKNTGSILYDYEIVSGSTYALDQKAQLDAIQGYIGMYLQFQTPQGNLLKEALDQEGYEFKFGELYKQGMNKSGIQEWSKILIEKTPGENIEGVLGQQQQQFQQLMQQMSQEMNQIPAQPQAPNMSMDQPLQPTPTQEQPMPPMQQPMNPMGGQNGF
jgi:hypothetical protein